MAAAEKLGAYLDAPAPRPPRASTPAVLPGAVNGRPGTGLSTLSRTSSGRPASRALRGAAKSYVGITCNEPPVLQHVFGDIKQTFDE